MATATEKANIMWVALAVLVVLWWERTRGAAQSALPTGSGVPSARSKKMGCGCSTSTTPPLIVGGVVTNRKGGQRAGAGTSNTGLVGPPTVLASSGAPPALPGASMAFAGPNAKTSTQLTFVRRNPTRNAPVNRPSPVGSNSKTPNTTITRRS
jgi:hypothetical protein